MNSLQFTSNHGPCFPYLADKFDHELLPIFQGLAEEGTLRHNKGVNGKPVWVSRLGSNGSTKLPKITQGQREQLLSFMSAAAPHARKNPSTNNAMRIAAELLNTRQLLTTSTEPSPVAAVIRTFVQPEPTHGEKLTRRYEALAAAHQKSPNSKPSFELDLLQRLHSQNMLGTELKPEAETKIKRAIELAATIARIKEGLIDPKLSTKNNFTTQYAKFKTTATQACTEIKNIITELGIASSGSSLLQNQQCDIPTIENTLAQARFMRAAYLSFDYSKSAKKESRTRLKSGQGPQIASKEVLNKRVETIVAFAQLSKNNRVGIDPVLSQEENNELKEIVRKWIHDEAEFAIIDVDDTTNLARLRTLEAQNIATLMGKLDQLGYTDGSLVRQYLDTIFENDAAQSKAMTMAMAAGTSEARNAALAKLTELTGEQQRNLDVLWPHDV